MRFPALLLVLLASCFAENAILRDDAGAVQLNITSTGTYTVSVNGAVWFNSGPYLFRGANKTDSSEDGTLTITANQTYTGSDALGAYNAFSFTWKGTSGFQYKTIFRSYTATPAIIFRVEFINNTTGTSNGDYNSLATSFPTIKLEGSNTTSTRGYTTWGGNMCWENQHTGNWNSNSAVPGGSSGGVPLVIFDQSSQNAVVWSPFSSFMSVNQKLWTTNAGTPVVGFGIYGSATYIPQDYSYETIFYAGTRISDAVLNWGEQLLKFYNKGRDGIQRDFSIQYLGYYTDAGACYWYNPGDKGNYEDTLIAVINDTDARQIPFRYIQLDSWWYYKGLANGVKNWTEINGPTYFPNGGIAAFQKAIRRPIVFHNRYWSADTDYAKQNGGQWNFILELQGQGTGYQNYAMPTDQDFWNYLIGGAKQNWDLIVYEQDWLDTEYDNLQHLHTDVTLGRQWLRQMNYGAETNGVNIQYCMSYPRHILQTVEAPAITQARASDDYYPNNDQWRLGETSLIFHALALAPYKDTFRSDSSDQGCSQQHGDTPEQTPELEALVSAISNGPIGPGDRLGKSNHDLLLRTCMTDGRLLKADTPGFAIDDTYIQRAFGSGGVDGEVWDSYTDVDGYTWHHIFAANVKTAYTLTPSKLIKPTSAGATTNLIYEYRTPNNVTVYDASSPLNIAPNGKTDYKFWHIAPVFANGWSLLGETDKFIAVSHPRFNHVNVDSNGIYVDLRGVYGEKITISFAQKDTNGYTVVSYGCVVPETGIVGIQVPGGKCIVV